MPLFIPFLPSLRLYRFHLTFLADTAASHDHQLVKWAGILERSFPSPSNAIRERRGQEVRGTEAHEIRVLG